MTADEPLPEHRVAITVFATTCAVDSLDAAHIATLAIRQAIATAAGNGSLAFPQAIPAKFRDESRPVQVVGAMETGTAAGNGYLWTAPTSKAFKEVERG